VSGAIRRKEQGAEMLAAAAFAFGEAAYDELLLWARLDL
jgi:hypothetical protein